MKLKSANKKILEYLLKHSPANTFRLSRHLGMDRNELISIIKDLTKKRLVDFKHGSVSVNEIRYQTYLKNKEKSKNGIKLSANIQKDKTAVKIDSKEKKNHLIQKEDAAKDKHPVSALVKQEDKALLPQEIEKNIDKVILEKEKPIASKDAQAAIKKPEIEIANSSPKIPKTEKSDETEVLKIETKKQRVIPKNQKLTKIKDTDINAELAQDLKEQKKEFRARESKGERALRAIDDDFEKLEEKPSEKEPKTIKEKLKKIPIKRKPQKAIVKSRIAKKKKKPKKVRIKKKTKKIKAKRRLGKEKQKELDNWVGQRRLDIEKLKIDIELLSLSHRHGDIGGLRDSIEKIRNMINQKIREVR